MGLLDALSSLFGGSSDSSSSSSESSDDSTWSKTSARVDRDTNTHEQHSLKGGKEDGGKHEHTWSSTSPAGHKEGWHGKDFETAGNKPKK